MGIVPKVGFTQGVLFGTPFFLPLTLYIMDEEQEDHLMDEHIKYLNEEFGEDQSLNLGWFTDDNSITSKLYGHKEIYSVTSTYIDENYTEIEHIKTTHNQLWKYA